MGKWGGRERGRESIKERRRKRNGKGGEAKRGEREKELQREPVGSTGET